MLLLRPDCDLKSQDHCIRFHLAAEYVNLFKLLFNYYDNVLLLNLY